MMSNFIDDLLMDLDTYSFSGIAKAKHRIRSLGENARQMLEIGIVQDELVKLGFEFGVEIVYPHIDYMRHDKKGIAINFYIDWVFVNEFGRIYYKSPTWQQDLLANVQELIGDES